MIGQTIGSYRIVSRIGAGGMGIVYLAEHILIGRVAALKVLRPRDGHSADGSLVSEARLLARVRHPNVVTIHGADVIDDEIGLWMELLQGQTLAAWVKGAAS